MEIVRFVVGVILPYAALVLFVGGMVYRFCTWSKLKAPPMTLFPAPADNKSTTVNTIQEAMFFKSLFKGDRLLWTLAWIFHAVLLLIFIGHFRVFTPIDDLLTPILGEEGVHAMSSYAGGAAGVLILITVILILFRRLSIQRVREITGGADYAALILIGAIIITGNAMRFGAEHFDLAETREYFAGLATFSNVLDMPVLTNNTFLLHMCLALVLIMLMPFSKILHFGGIFFTHQLVRKH